MLSADVNDTLQYAPRSAVVMVFGPSNSNSTDSPQRRVSVATGLVPGHSFAELHTVIRDTCNRFLKTTGWALTFQRAEGDLADELEQRLHHDETCFWYKRIRSGLGTIGLLSIVRGRENRTVQAPLPGNPVVQSRLRRLVFPLPDACDAAEIIVNLLNQIATRTQVLELSRRARVSFADFDKNAQQRLDVLRMLSGFDAVALFIAYEEEVRLLATSGIDRDNVPDPMRTRDPDSVDDVVLRTGKSFTSDSDFLPVGFRHAVCLPVDRRNTDTGTVWLYSTAPSSTTEAIDQARSLSGRFAGTFDEPDADAASRLRKELGQLTQIQRAAEALPDLADSSLDFSWFSRGGGEMNGDLCERMSMSPHRTVIAVGDACGHGLPATIITSTVRGCLRCLVREDPVRPAELLKVISQAISTTTPTYMFMTLFIGVVDTKQGKLIYSSAGHPAPLLIRSTGKAKPLPGQGLVLGVMPDADYENFEIGFESSDTLIAFSDGITEARNEKKEMFRTSGVLDAVKSANLSETTSQQVLDQILGTARRHSADRFLDDTTLVVVRSKPTISGSAITAMSDSGELFLPTP